MIKFIFEYTLTMIFNAFFYIKDLYKRAEITYYEDKNSLKLEVAVLMTRLKNLDKDIVSYKSKITKLSNEVEELKLIKNKYENNELVIFGNIIEYLDRGNSILKLKNIETGKRFNVTNNLNLLLGSKSKYIKNKYFTKLKRVKFVNNKLIFSEYRYNSFLYENSKYDYKKEKVFDLNKLGLNIKNINTLSLTNPSGFTINNKELLTTHN